MRTILTAIAMTLSMSAQSATKIPESLIPTLKQKPELIYIGNAGTRASFFLAKDHIVKTGELTETIFFAIFTETAQVNGHEATGAVVKINIRCSDRTVGVIVRAPIGPDMKLLDNPTQRTSPAQLPASRDAGLNAVTEKICDKNLNNQNGQQAVLGSPSYETKHPETFNSQAVSNDSEDYRVKQEAAVKKAVEEERRRQDGILLDTKRKLAQQEAKNAQLEAGFRRLEQESQSRSVQSAVASPDTQISGLPKSPEPPLAKNEKGSAEICANTPVISYSCKIGSWDGESVGKPLYSYRKVDEQESEALEHLIKNNRYSIVREAYDAEKDTCKGIYRVQGIYKGTDYATNVYCDLTSIMHMRARDQKKDKKN